MSPVVHFVGTIGHLYIVFIDGLKPCPTLFTDRIFVAQPQRIQSLAEVQADPYFAKLNFKAFRDTVSPSLAFQSPAPPRALHTDGR